MAKNKVANSDQKILDLIEQVRKQKQEIANVEKGNWKTHCSFQYVEGNGNTSVNIKTVADIKTLVVMAASLRDRHKSYVDAAQELGVISPPSFTWCGHTYSEWLNDLKLRIDRIQIDAKRKSLEVLEERLNKIVTPELRAKMELESISKELLGA